MLPAVLLFALIAGGPGEPAPPPPLPASPAGALALDPLPPAPLDPAISPAVPGSVPPDPGLLPPGLALLLASMLLLIARPRGVAAAEDDIRAALQDNLFSDVGHDDLTTVARILHDLDPPAARAVVDRLSDRELGVWMRELDGWRGGLTGDERRQLFADLAGRLGPSQLARLISQGHAAELIEAAAVHASGPDRATLAFVLWEDGTLSDRHWRRIAGLAEAAPAGALESAVAGRPAAPLIDALLGTDGPEDDQRVRFDALARFLAPAAHFEDPAVKARLFTAAAAAVAANRGDGREEVLGRLAGLLRSDPAGIIGWLNHSVDPHGNVLSGWIEDMIKADRIDELDVLLHALLGGTERLAVFSDPGPSAAHPYPNAANLGYYIGAYSVAIEHLADDAAGRIDLVSRLFSLVTGVVPGPQGSQVRLPLGPLVDAHAESVIAGLRAEAGDIRQALWDLAKPRSADGLLWNGPGTTQFQDAWEEVVLVR